MFITENQFNFFKKLTEDKTPVQIYTLSGEHGSGKDAYALMLQKFCTKLGISEIVRFADPLRDSFSSVGIEPWQYDVVKRLDMTFKPGIKIEGFDVSGLTAREAIIEVARQTQKEYGDFYYANIVIQRISEIVGMVQSQYETAVAGAPRAFIIIPDLRFEPEFEALKTLTVQDCFNWRHIEIGKDLPALRYI